MISYFNYFIIPVPEPILTDTLISEFNLCVQLHTNSAATATSTMNGLTTPTSTSYYTAPAKVPEALPMALSPLVSRLPPYEFYLLRAICQHLAKIDSECAKNKMNLSNLGLIFCPTLSLSSIVFKAFVGSFDVVFEKGCETAIQALEEEEKESEKLELEREKRKPEIYRRTNISDDFSKSLQDLLNFDSLGVVTTPPSDNNLTTTGSSSSNLNLEDGEGMRNSGGERSSVSTKTLINNINSISSSGSSSNSSTSSLNASHVTRSAPPSPLVTAEKNNLKVNKNPFEETFTRPRPPPPPQTSKPTNNNIENNKCLPFGKPRTFSQPPQPSAFLRSTPTTNKFISEEKQEHIQMKIPRPRSASTPTRLIPNLQQQQQQQQSSSSSSQQTILVTPELDEEALNRLPPLITFNYFDNKGSGYGILNIAGRPNDAEKKGMRRSVGVVSVNKV